MFLLRLASVRIGFGLGLGVSFGSTRTFGSGKKGNAPFALLGKTQRTADTLENHFVCLPLYFPLLNSLLPFVLSFFNPFITLISACNFAAKGK